MDAGPVAVAGPLRILLLEDSPLDADLIREHVSRLDAGAAVDHVTGGPEFQEALGRRHYDAILADYVLPGFSGDAALEIARRLAPLTPFIFVSGTLGEELAVESLKRGATDYVLKSRLQRLPSALSRAIAEARERAELERTAQALEASEARLRLALEAGRLGTWELDLGTGRILRTDYHDRIFGYDGMLPEWNYAALLFHVLPEDRERLDEAIRGASAGRGDWCAQCRIRRADDGEVRWIEFRGGPGPGTGGASPGRMSGIIADITERKLAEDAQRQQNEALEQRVAERTAELAGMVNRLNAEMLRRERTESVLEQAQKMDAIGQMTGGVAHDFNNLLTVLVSHLDLIQHSVGDPERVRQLAAAALDAADRGVRLTGHLLAFARRQTLRPQTVSVNQLLRDFEPLVRRALGEAVELGLELDAEVGNCRIDPTQFEVAILNLAVNARDAMAGGGRLAVRTAPADVAASPDGPEPGRYVRVTVSDTGSGMPEEVLARVFEPFFTTKGVGRGSGLGLSQVYGFARQSGGHVSLESGPGAGTRVTLLLPCVAGRPEEPVRADAGAAGSQQGRGELVLVVEDDELVRGATAETLRELGYRVRTAADGAEALAAIEAQRPDAVFTDMVMPGGLSGAQLAGAVRRRWPDLPVLMASGYAAPDPGDPVGSLVEGIPLLNKPFRRAALAQGLRALLDRRPGPLPAPATRMEREGTNMRVLLVEDELLIRMSCADMLSDLGHEVAEAADPQEALAALRNGDGFDVLMTDVGLPGMPGTELARLARAENPALRVVYVTGQQPDEALTEGDPMVSVLMKPYRKDDLERILRALAAS